MSQRGRWSEEETQILLKLIAASPAIYNPFDPRYHDRYLKDTIWSNICDKTKKSVAMCKKQWSYLRCSRNLDFLKDMEYNKKTCKYTCKRISRRSRVDTDESSCTIKKTLSVADSNKPNDTVEKSSTVADTNKTNDIVEKTSRLVNADESKTTVKKISLIEVPLSILAQTVNTNEHESTVKKTIIAQNPKKRPAEHQNKEETQNKISKPKEKEDPMNPPFIAYVIKTLSEFPPFLRVKARNEIVTVLTKFRLMAEGRDPREILQPNYSQDSSSQSNALNNLRSCLFQKLIHSIESASGEAEQELYTSSQNAMQDNISKEEKQSQEIASDESPEESKVPVSEIRIKTEDFNVSTFETKNNFKEFKETTKTGLTHEIMTNMKIKSENLEITPKAEPGWWTEPGMSIEPDLSTEQETKFKTDLEEQVIKSEEEEMYIKSEPIDFPISVEENIY